MPVETTIVLPQPSSPSAPALTRIQDGTSTALAVVIGLSDAIGGGNNGLLTDSATLLYDNAANLVRARYASASALIAQSGLGAALVAPPGMWAATNQGGAGVGAGVTQAAGGAAVRHVCTSMLSTFTGATTLAAAGAQTLFLRDGASGAGIVKAQHVMSVPATAGSQAPTITQTFNVPGTLNTAATLEFGAGVTNVFEAVTLTGYDAS